MLSYTYWLKNRDCNPFDNPNPAILQGYTGKERMFPCQYSSIKKGTRNNGECCKLCQDHWKKYGLLIRVLEKFSNLFEAQTPVGEANNPDL
jgi:hypothetical protein